MVSMDTMGENKMKNIIFDIETLTLDPLEGGAQVVCIGYACGDYKAVLMSTSEKNLLRKFWKLPFFEGHFRLIGFNSFTFDIPYLIVRSFKHGIQIPDIKGRCIDLRFVLSYGNKYKNGKLGDYAKLILGKKGKKTDSGDNVKELWKSKEYNKLRNYCLNDIFLTYKIYERLKDMGVLS